MAITITKQLIESIASKDNKQYVKSINEKVNNLMSLTIESLGAKMSYVSFDNTVLQPANELFSDSIVDNSEFVYLLGIDSPQLDMNTVKASGFWNNFKARCKYAWDNRTMFRKRKKRKKRRKKKQQEENNGKLEVPKIKFDPTKYTVYSLAEDLQQELCNHLQPTSIVYQGNNKIEIVGKEDFGPNVRIIIYLTSYVEGDFKYYTGKRKRKFLDLNIQRRYKILKDKKKSAGKYFVKVMRLFNALYFNINLKTPNQIFLESVLCSCPDEIFVGEDIYKVFIKVINYISVKTLKNIPSILDEELTIFEDIRCGDNGLGFNKIISSIQSDDLKVKKNNAARRKSFFS